MLILFYQRLYLFSLFLSGQSDHPLLAIYTSRLLSKPNTPPCILLTILIILYLAFFIKKIVFILLYSFGITKVTWFYIQYIKKGGIPPFFDYSVFTSSQSSGLQYLASRYNSIVLVWSVGTLISLPFSSFLFW